VRGLIWITGFSMHFIDISSFLSRKACYVTARPRKKISSGIVAVGAACSRDAWSSKVRMDLLPRKSREGRGKARREEEAKGDSLVRERVPTTMGFHWPVGFGFFNAKARSREEKPRRQDVFLVSRTDSCRHFCESAFANPQKDRGKTQREAETKGTSLLWERVPTAMGFRWPVGFGFFPASRPFLTWPVLYRSASL